MPQLHNRMNRALLRGFERLAVPALETLHSRPGLRQAMHATVGKFNGMWIEASTHRLWQVEQFDNVATLKAPRGLVLVSNHRSFFDMYLLSTLLNQRTNLLKRVCFPVRSEFFYTHPVGMLLNVSVSGGAMWPPVFRDGSRRELNRTGFAQIGETLIEGSVVGIHPEGKRNPGDDPYTYLPLKRGLGMLVEACDAETLVLPCFICGVSNDVRQLTTRGWRYGEPRGEMIRMWFGEPMRVGDLQATGDDAMGITERVFAEVRALGERDRTRDAR